LASLSVHLPGASLDPPHRDACWRFSTVVTPPPVHTVTVQVLADETAKPIDMAEVRLGPYRAMTAATGEAQIRLATGRYDLHIWKVGFEAQARVVAIGGDAVIRIDAAIVPEENADRAWRG